MKTNFILLVAMFVAVFTLQAQDATLEDLKAMQAEKSAAAAELQGQADALAGEAAGLQGQIDKLSGWRKGLGGVFGFDLAGATNWATGDVANVSGSNKSSGLGADISGYLLKDSEKTFWHNKLKVVENYKDIDLVGDTNTDDKLFDNQLADIFNISSLAGYKITDKLSLSAQGELNSTLLKNFLNPGIIDIGTGLTWLPIENMTVMFHPLNYNAVIRRDGDIDGTAALGSKFRIDYFKDVSVNGKNFHWDTNLTGFLPYSSLDNPTAGQGNQYWQWLNNVTFEVWNGIGVGIGFGFRKSDFEAYNADGTSELQSYRTLGLSYAL